MVLAMGGFGVEFRGANPTLPVAFASGKATPRGAAVAAPLGHAALSRIPGAA